MAQMEMTSMIDVVFQLIIFFVVALKQEDILSHFDVSRPAAGRIDEVRPLPLIQITVGPDGYAVNGKRFTLEELDRHMMRLSTFGANQSVLVRCTGDSRHSRLVQALDVCARTGFTKLSVFSM